MPQTNEQEALRSARLQDIPVSALEEAIPELLARSSPLFDAQYGSRSDDDALIFHFYPPGHAIGASEGWTDWTAFRDRLEQAIMRCFDLVCVEADYVSELESFFLMVRPPPQVPDQTALIEKFFSLLEA